MLLLFILLFFLSAIPVRAAESVTQFTSEITINQDTSVSVSELIKYQTNESKHGIYRYIPLKHTLGGLNYQIGVNLNSITDMEGKEYQVKESYESGTIQWRIGDPEKTFTGQKVYFIDYLYSDVIRQFDSYDELFLDIVGEGWQFPVETTMATIRSPYAPIVDVVCFGGEVGTNDQLCQINQTSPQEITVTYNQAINYGQNLSVAVKLDPNNQLLFPTQWQRRQKWLLENLWIFVVPLPLLLMFSLWYLKGRDYIFLSANIFDMSDKPQKLRPLLAYQRTPLVYQPLHELTPGEAGAIIDEKVDNRDIIAELIDLARKKYLRIEPEEKGTSIFKTKDYVFIKLKEIDEDLPAHQKFLLQKLFHKRDQVKLSKLKGSFYTTMNKTKEMILDSSQDKKLFTAHPQKTMITYAILSILLLIAVLAISSYLAPINSPLPFILSILQFVAVPFFAKGMIQKSAIGSNYYLQARGLKETIRRGAWREKIHEKNLFIDEVLPFAVSFDVIRQLTKDMEALNLKAPDYLAASGWHTANFAQTLNQFGSQASRSLAYNPSSSSGSGGSGFSGGSSGGGVGGGGGGSW